MCTRCLALTKSPGSGGNSFITMHDGGTDDSMRRLTSSRNLERNKGVMVEPKAKMDSSLASEVKASSVSSMFDGKSPIRTHSLPQPFLPHPPTHHVGPFYHLSPKAVVDPGHYAQTIVALEAELQRAHSELSELKEQLAASENGKAQALKEFTNIKNLLDQISLVEHFAASDNVEVEAAPLPPNWSGGSSGQLDMATQQEIDRLRNELEASKNLNSKFAAELDKAKQEVDDVRHRRTELENSRMELNRLQSELEAGRDHQESIYLELDNARKDISTLQATVSDAWSHHGACALELARAKEEIAWLEADLEAAQNLTAELAHAKDEINVLHEDLAVARELQKTSSLGLLKAKEEISKLRSQCEASASELATAIHNNSVLQAELEELREASTTELQNARQEIFKLRAANETTISECANAKDEIHRLQGELAAAFTSGRDSATALRDTEDKMENLQSELEYVKGRHDNTCTELSEAMRQIENLNAELECLRVKYESCSSELFYAKEDVFRLEVEQLASNESLMTDIRLAQEENSKLQMEVAALKAEKISLSVQLAEAREEINHLQAELEAAGKRHDTARRELFTAGKDIARLQGELSAILVQHRELEILKDASTNFQTELAHVQELHSIVMAELINAREEVAKLQLVSTEELENSLQVVRDLKQEIGEVQVDLSTHYTALLSEKSVLEQKTKDMDLELMRLQEASAAQKKQAETELAAKEDVAARTLREELETVRAELVKAREAETKLEKMTLEVEELRAQMTTDVSADVDAIRAELDAAKKSEANYREFVTSSQAQIEDLKVHLYALRDSEAKVKESLVSTTSELQRKKMEFEMAREALEWVGGDAAAVYADLEALKAEILSTKEGEARAKDGEARAKAAFADYSLKLQKMRLDLEDATKLADKVPIKPQVAKSKATLKKEKGQHPSSGDRPTKLRARTFKLDLDEVTARLEKVMESERAMAASMASLKAELNNALSELVATREDYGAALAEKEQQYELELKQMRAQLEVAVLSEATLTDANFALNESLIKVMAEAEEAAFAEKQATQEAEKARQEVEDAEARIETLKANLETLLLEVEAAKATEDWAFAQMRLKTIPECEMETEEQGAGEVAVSSEEYQSLKTKAKELQELVNKRAAVGMAQVNAAKASEREMQRRVETLQRELRSCRTELNEAISKREEAEAAKFSCEAALRAKRLERRSLSQSGTLNNGHPMGKFMNVGDRQGSLNSICFEDSQSSSSPSRSSKSFASFASPGRSDRSPMESIAQVLNTRTPSEEKQRKPKFSTKIQAYFSKKKDSSAR